MAAREQFNVRLPGMTLEQIDLITSTYGLTKTQAIIVAVDRMTAQVDPEKIDEDEIFAMVHTANTFPASEEQE